MYKAKHVDTEKVLKYIKDLRNRYFQECEVEKQMAARYYAGLQKGLDIAENIFLCSNYEADESEDKDNESEDNDER